MDARLRERRGILRVSASRHIDCSVRRRPFGSMPFYTALANLFLAAPLCRCARPRAGCAAPRSRTPPAAVLLVRSATLAHHARDAPSSAFRPRSPRSVLAHRALFRPYPSTSGGKSLILKRVADNRAPYSRFRFQDVSKTATHSEMLEKPPLI